MSFQPNFRSEVLLGGSRRLRKAFTAILIRQRNPIKTFGTDMSSELRKNAHRNMQFSLLPVSSKVTFDLSNVLLAILNAEGDRTWTKIKKSCWQRSEHLKANI